MRSHDKLKLLYINYNNACGYQTWQGGDMQWELPSINSHNALITWSCKVAWQIKCYISTTTMTTATTLGKVVLYNEELFSIRSVDKLNMLYFYYHKTSLVIKLLPVNDVAKMCVSELLFIYSKQNSLHQGYKNHNIYSKSLASSEIFFKII